MIFESWPWKQQLARCAAALQRRKCQRRWPEASLVLLERELFFAAYAVRKLIEANKLSDELESTSVAVIEYRSVGRAVDHFNRDKIDELYDLSDGSSSTVSLLSLCNQFIHSFVFVPCFNDERGLAGVFLASDRTKDSRLLWVNVDEVIGLLLAVADDDVVSTEWRRSGPGEPLRVVKKSSKTPTKRGEATGGSDSEAGTTAQRGFRDDEEAPGPGTA